MVALLKKYFIGILTSRKIYYVYFVVDLVYREITAENVAGARVNFQAGET